jgi:hypothetical protein
MCKFLELFSHQTMNFKYSKSSSSCSLLKTVLIVLFLSTPLSHVGAALHMELYFRATELKFLKQLTELLSPHHFHFIFPDWLLLHIYTLSEVILRPDYLKIQVDLR